MQLLYAADRLQHVRDVIRPALSAGHTVICDRYHLSTLVYLLASSQGDYSQDLLTWGRSLARNTLKADLTIVMQVGEETAARRLAGRSTQDLYDARDMQRRVSHWYSLSADLLPGERVAFVDGEGDESAVHQRILTLILNEVRHDIR